MFVTIALYAALFTELTDRDLLIGMQSARERVYSGEFHAAGRIVDDDPATGLLQGDAAIEGAFDHRIGTVRFDRKEPFRESTRRDQKNNILVPVSADDWTPGSMQIRFFLTPEKLAFWSSFGKNSVMIRSPDDYQPAQFARICDVRGIGCISGGDFRDGMTLSKLFSGLQAYTTESVVRETDSIYRWTSYRKSKIFTQRRLWIDISKDFAPVRYEVRWNLAGKEEGIADAQPVIESHTTWQKAADVWVPQSFSSRDAAATSGSVYQIDLSFEWTRINGEVREELLQEESLVKDVYAVVTDSRLGKPVIVKHLNYGSSNYTKTAEVSHRQGYLIFANVIGILFAMLAWRIGSKGKTTS